MRLPRPLRTPAIALLAALACVGTGTATGAQGDPRVPGAKRVGQLVPVPTRATAGVITPTPTVPSGDRAQANKAAQKRLARANPPKKSPRVVRPYRGPALGAPTGGAQPEGAIEQPGTGAPATGPVVRAAGRAAAGARREMASGDLSAFRVSTVTDMDVTGSPWGPSWIGEPTAANDRNAILFTANWYAAFSSDNGRTWGYIDPVAAFPSLDGGFCCDQYAVSIPRDGYNDIAWVLQNAADSSDNSYRLVVLNGRSGIASLGGTIEYCSYVIRPGDFPDMPSGYMLDYPAMQPTGQWLYLTAVAGSITAGTMDRAVIWRVRLSDLGSCGGTPQGVTLEDHYSLRPITGAARGTTMYMGHLPIGSTTFGKKFDVLWATDSSTTVNSVQKNIHDWPTDQPTCRVSGSTTNDPCGRLTGKKVLAGYRSSSRVGFLFTTGVGSSSTDYPYTRVVRFNPTSLAIEGENDIWNDAFAWTFPSAGVTSRGDVGGGLIAMGGSVNPTAVAYMVDDISNSWESLATRTFTSSDAAPNGSCTSSRTGRGGNCMGDYFTSASYTGCSNTLLATTVVQQNASAGAGPAHRSAWIGRERDACADLQVSGVSVGPAGSGRIEGGGQISVGDTTANTGSASTPGTTTAYFLSRDDTRGGGDARLGTRAVPAIAAGSSSAAGGQVLTLPDMAFGEYHVIACADDADAVAEVSNTNNCTASPPFAAAWSPSAASTRTSPLWDRAVKDPLWAGTLRAGGTIVVTAEGRINPVVPVGANLGPLGTATPEGIPWNIFLAVDDRPVPHGRLIGTLPTGPLKPIPLPGGPLRQWVGTLRGTAVLPRWMPAGRYFVITCAPDLADDVSAGPGCAVSRKALVMQPTAKARGQRARP